MNETGIVAQSMLDPKCPQCGAALPNDAVPLSPVVCAACGATVMVPGALGQYRLVRLIGTGGMGAVYEGFDDGLQRKVAVKVILRGKAAEDPTFIESFRREAQSAARLNSPEIVGVYAFGEAEGQPYLVMELVQPDSLDRMMKSGPVMPATALRVGMQIAQGLKAAADQGLVHGDVKPENILINDAREAKLADFGIAALAGAKAAANNEVWGTPYYIAPETLLKQKVDLRADIYSLGGTLYHAIAGVPPFEGPDAVEVMKARLLGPARPLSEVAPDCPEPVSKIIMRMLEAEPGRRYPNYDSLLTDMRKELRSAKSRTGGGKRIVIKGKVTPSVALGGPSRPMPSVANPNAPLISEKKPIGKGTIVGLAVGLGCGVPILVAVILGLTLFVAAKKKSEKALEASSLVVATGTSTTDLAVAQAVADGEALVRLSEESASRVVSAKTAAAEAVNIVKMLAKQAERAVLPEQTSWLAPAEGEAPTEMLRELQGAFAKSVSLTRAAQGAEALRAKIDGLRAIAGQPETPPEQVSSALTEAKAVVEAYGKTPEAASAAADLKALQVQRRDWRKTVDRARAEMEEAVAARLTADRKAKAAAAEAEAAERAREVVAAEVASVATMEAAVGGDLDRFMPEVATETFATRTARLKSPEAQAVAQIAAGRIAAFRRLKDWIVEGAKSGTLVAYGVTAADAEGITLSGRRMAWKDFVADHQAVAFRILSVSIADDAGSRALRASDRASLAVSARLFITRCFGKEMLEKSKSLRDVMDKLQSVAEGLPGSKAELERLEGTVGTEE